MRCLVVSSRDVFGSRNNPSSRMDCGFLMAIAELRQGTGNRHTIEAMCRDSKQFKDWIRELRKKKKFTQVMDHIVHLMIGRTLSSFSPDIQQGIVCLARKICQEEHQVLVSELAE